MGTAMSWENLKRIRKLRTQNRVCFFLGLKSKSIQLIAIGCTLGWANIAGAQAMPPPPPDTGALGIQNTPQTAQQSQSNNPEANPAAESLDSGVAPALPAGQERQPPSPTITLHTTVRRVAVDVVVTDNKGRPVRGLTRSDFRVYEDGVPQTVLTMDAHDLTGGPGNSTLADTLKLPPNTFSNLVRAPEGSPVVVILYDMLNTPVDAMPYAHQAIVKFIKAQRQGSRIAIFVLGSRLRMLQGFTDDETRLLNVLNSKTAHTQQSSLLLTADSSNVSPTDPNAAADPTTALADALSSLTSLETSETVLMQQERLEATEDAFAEIARFVSTLPGRKNLIWMSGSFPSNALPNTDPTAQGTNNEFGNTYQMEEKVKKTNDLLNAAHVSVYPVDVRGLQVNPTFSAGSIKGPGNRPSIVGNANEAAEHGTMDTIAESTGGRAFYNTNGLQQAMQTALNEGSTYYTLTYKPTNDKYDGTQRKIKVELLKSGYQLSYRRSYFADDLTHPTETPQSAVAQADLLVDADMQHGSPISSELFFEAGVYPIGGVMQATPKEMEQLSQFMATKTKAKKEQLGSSAPQVQHYQIDYAILGRQLDMSETSAGKYMTDMIFAVAAYSADSLIVNGLEVSVKNQIPTAQYQKIRTQGYHAKLDFVVPVEASSLRVAVRDGIGNKIGSIEIPLPVASQPAQTTMPATK
jgi:VWFA-related protein